MKSLLSLTVLLTTTFSAPTPPSSSSSSPSHSFPITDVLGTGLTIDEYAQQLQTPHSHSHSPSLSKRQYTTDTYNQLTDGTPCKDITIIYARGTTQAGNVGAADKEGPLIFDALATLLQGTTRLAIQGVDYSASIGGFLSGGDAAGAQTMLGLINLASTQCPSTEIVVSGYSQGAQLVHIATQQLSADVAARVTAVLTLGDPDRNDSFGLIDSSKILVFCHDGDEICEGSIIVTPEHLDYEKDSATLAAFIASKV